MLLTEVMPARPEGPQRLHVYWAIFAASVGCFLLGGLAGDRLGALAPVVAIGGTASCGWSWLLTRALFRPGQDREVWPAAIVAALIATGAVLELAAGTGDVLRVVRNIHSLTSSTVLLLAFVEAFHGYRDAPARERRFRATFAAAYGGLVAVSVLWVNQSGEGGLAAAWGDGIKLVCAMIAFGLASLAVVWRDRHPLPVPAMRGRRAAAPADPVLQGRIQRLLDHEEIYTVPELKVADLARMTGAPEYKVSQCVTGAMGFRNFNVMINARRIAHARRLLADPDMHGSSVLAIAMESGFASIGPFNRAFKQETGMTPAAFRAASRAETETETRRA